MSYTVLEDEEGYQEWKDFRPRFYIGEDGNKFNKSNKSGKVSHCN